MDKKMPARFKEKRAGVKQRTKTPSSPIHDGHAWTPGQLSCGDLGTGTRAHDGGTIEHFEF
jgi:hypothetical protein